MNPNEIPTPRTELKPCPFCGCNPIPYDGDFKLVHTPSCFLEKEHGWIVGTTKINIWNTRDESKLHLANQQVEELKQKFEFWRLEQVKAAEKRTEYIASLEKEIEALRSNKT